jgi:hypothetical protein
VVQSLLAVVSLVLFVGLELAGQPAGMPSTKNGDWTHYTADMRGIWNGRYHWERRCTIRLLGGIVLPY